MGRDINFEVHAIGALLHGGSKSVSELARFLSTKALSSLSPDRYAISPANAFMDCLTLLSHQQSYLTMFRKI